MMDRIFCIDEIPDFRHVKLSDEFPFGKCPGCGKIIQSCNEWIRDHHSECNNPFSHKPKRDTFKAI